MRGSGAVRRAAVQCSARTGVLLFVGGRAAVQCSARTGVLLFSYAVSAKRLPGRYLPTDGAFTPRGHLASAPLPTDVDAQVIARHLTYLRTRNLAPAYIDQRRRALLNLAAWAGLTSSPLHLAASDVLSRRLRAAAGAQVPGVVGRGWAVTARGADCRSDG